jgi:hypothetical protein
MSATGDSLAERVQSSYLQLSSVASDLNAVSDELGKSVAEIDAVLKRLNLGISVWVHINSWGDEDYSFEDIGYAKVDGKWGIALQTVSGNERWPDQDHVEQWLFSDAPRKLRLASIEKLPEMLKKLSEEAVETTKKIKGKLAEVKEVATAVKTAELRGQTPPTVAVFRHIGASATIPATSAGRYIGGEPTVPAEQPVVRRIISKGPAVPATGAVGRIIGGEQKK